MYFFCTSSEPVFFTNTQKPLPLLPFFIVSGFISILWIGAILTIFILMFINLKEKKFDQIINILVWIVVSSTLVGILIITILLEVNKNQQNITSNIDNVEIKYVDSQVKKLRNHNNDLINILSENKKQLDTLYNELKAYSAIQYVSLSDFSNKIKQTSNILKSNNINNLFYKIQVYMTDLDNIKTKLKTINEAIASVNTKSDYNQYNNVSTGSKIELIYRIHNKLNDLSLEIDNIQNNISRMKSNPEFNGIDININQFQNSMSYVLNNNYNILPAEEILLTKIFLGPFSICNSSLNKNTTLPEFLDLYKLTLNDSLVNLNGKKVGMTLSIDPYTLFILKYNNLLYIVCFKSNKLLFITDGNQLMVMETLKNIPCEISLLNIPNMQFLTYDIISNNDQIFGNIGFSTLILTNPNISKQSFILKNNQFLQNIPPSIETINNNFNLQFADGKFSMKFFGIEIYFEYLYAINIILPSNAKYTFSRLSDFVFQCNNYNLDGNFL